MVALCSLTPEATSYSSMKEAEPTVRWTSREPSVKGEKKWPGRVAEAVGVLEGVTELVGVFEGVCELEGVWLAVWELDPVPEDVLEVVGVPV